MEKSEIVQQLSQKVDQSWAVFVEDLLKLSPKELIGQAEMISATRLCRDQLKSGEFAEHQLEYLLGFDDPLMTMRDQWMAVPIDHHDAFEHELWVLWDHGPDPYAGPSHDEMEMR